MTLRTPKEGISEITETDFRAQFMQMVLVIKTLEEEKGKLSAQLEKTSFLDRPALRHQLQDVDAQLAQQNARMVEYVVRFGEIAVPHLLKLASKIFREVYQKEEHGTSGITYRNPMNLRPIGISKSIAFHETVRSFMASDLERDKSRVAVVKDRTDKIKILFEQELGLAPLGDQHIYKKFVDELIFIEGMRFSDHVQTVNTDTMREMDDSLERAISTEGLDPEVIIRIAQIVHPDYAFLIPSIIRTKLRVKERLE